MDSIQVALLMLAALVVGMLLVVMVQVWFLLKQLQQDLRDTHAKLDPLINELQTVVAQVRGATHIASAVSLAITAGIQAWRETRSGKDATAGSAHDAL